MKIPRIKSCAFVELSGLVPKDWDWWYAAFADLPWSFGDTDRTMISAARLREHFRHHMREDAFERVPEAELDEFERLLKALGSTYIDLEN